MILSNYFYLVSIYHFLLLTIDLNYGCPINYRQRSVMIILRRLNDNIMVESMRKMMQSIFHQWSQSFLHFYSQLGEWKVYYVILIHQITKQKPESIPLNWQL